MENPNNSDQKTVLVLQEDLLASLAVLSKDSHTLDDFHHDVFLQVLKENVKTSSACKQLTLEGLANCVLDPAIRKDLVARGILEYALLMFYEMNDRSVGCLRWMLTLIDRLLGFDTADQFQTWSPLVTKLVRTAQTEADEKVQNAVRHLEESLQFVGFYYNGYYGTLFRT